MRTILGLALVLLVVALATTSPAQAPEHLWSEGFGGFSNDVGTAIGVDALGNVVVVGYFSQAMNLGGANLVSAGGFDIFVAKYDANGAHLWSQRFGGPGDDKALAVALDGSGNIFVTGYFNGTVNFGGGNLVTAWGNDMFLAKYNASGAHQWSQRFGGVSGEVGNAAGIAVAVDGSGNVLATGDFNGTANFGGGNFASAGNLDIFLAKYNANGVHQWSQHFGSFFDDSGAAVAVDGSGYIFMTGFFNHLVDFGGGAFDTGAGSDVFLAKYDANGVHQWSRSFGNAYDAHGTGLAVDGSGNVVVTGGFSGTVDFGGGGIASAGFSTDIFLAKYNTNGVHQWSKRFGGGNVDVGSAVAMDGSGNVVVTGSFENSVYFGGNLGWSSAGASDMFIARFSAGGVYQYSRAGGGAVDDFGNAVAVDGSGKAVVTGNYSGAADFGGASLAGSGANDIFIVKYGSEPIILGIKDVPLDQGGVLKLLFQPSSHDGPGMDPLVTQYEAFRRNISPAGPPWLSVGQIPATMAGEYEMPAPTDADSTCGSGQHYSYYFIRAHTDTPGVFYDSPIDSGYSVDNLAPGVPTNLTYAAGHLSWDASTAADFDHFSVYGNSSNSFGSATFVNNTVTPGMSVPPPLYAYYFVTATDHACNESDAASTGTLTGVGGSPTSYVLSISAYPNPFNPETTIRYTLPAKGRVTIEVFDARGSHVVTLVNEAKGAGAYTATWNGHSDRGNAAGSGVYFARLTSPVGTRSYKLTLLK
jgi:FlgD Ig-like domain/Beta-propeller repeat